MNTKIALLIFGTTICWLLPRSFALFCKKGFAEELSGAVHLNKKGVCKAGFQHCYTVTCTAWDQPGNTYIYWGCAKSKVENECDNERARTERTTLSENVTCDCSLGEKGVDWANALITPPPITKNRDELLQTVLGCTNAKNCSAVAISADVRRATEMTGGINCECQFGEKGVEFGNKYMEFGPKMPTNTTNGSTIETTAITTSTDTANSTGTITKQFSPPTDVKIEAKLQCLALQICNPSEMWGRAKLSRRFAIRKKCEEMFENWPHMKDEKISKEYEMSANNKNGQANGQAFLADFIGAAIKSEK
ncbi:hypothetical protein niasHT_024724 [Heterodera trifolii]|uniref:Uncharacterized protein n=1 Tax=Heterodera trifolii TaxID=157864 RepID=A0ABD2K0R0_9BILA